MSRKCTIWVVVISLYLTNVQSTCLEHDAEVLLLCCKSHFKSRHRHGTRPLMLFISPCSFIHPFNVFSQTLCWRSQCAQSVYIPDIPRCLHAVFISTSFAVHRIMLHSETVCSFRNGYIARLHIQHFHSHTPVLGGVLHRSLGKFWLVNVKIILKVMLGCWYLKCLSIWTSGCSLWRMWRTYWLRGRRQLFGGPTDCVEEGNYLIMWTNSAWNCLITCAVIRYRSASTVRVCVCVSVCVCVFLQSSSGVKLYIKHACSLQL